MADNTKISYEESGDTIATDDIGGVKYQRMKIISGADGVNDGDVSATNPLPVTLGAYQNVVNAADNITTVNYTDSGKLTVSSIVQTSAIVGYTVTETYNSSGATTLVITRVIT